MRHVTFSGVLLIQHFEGFSPRLYICPAGYPTIGYGHLIKRQEKFTGPIGRAEAGELLRQDILIAEQVVVKCVHVPLTDNQFDALVSFTFNLGAAAFERSTLRQKVNREEHDAVPAEFMRWVWALGRRSRGLMQRRKAEAVMYTGNVL